jgi:glycosyltransferase involved in cell wall biosynthesis
MYPEFHETFVAREIEALRRTGTDIAIYTLKKPLPEGNDLYPQHRDILHQANYIMDWRVWLANFMILATRPLRYVGAITGLIRLYWKRPVELMKALVAFPKTVHFARGMERRGGILHAHWATIPASMGLVINRLTDIPVSLTAHAWDIFLSPKEELRRKIAAVKGVVTCTGFNVKYLQDVCQPEDRSKILLNYHGLDFTTLQELEPRARNDSTCRILSVGRLVEQKGFVYLIRALGELSGLAVRLSIIGEGPLESELKQAASGLPNGSQVEFLGRLGHLETLRFMAESDVMAAPSIIAQDGDRDGIPNVILEAMGCGTPIIGTEVSGIPEVVIDGETGYLVAPEDPGALAAAIRKMIEDRHGRQKMGEKARSLVRERFDMNRNIEEFLRYLQRFHAA